MPGPPTIPKKKKPAGKCAHHPRYEGKGSPKAACPVCWGMYLESKYGLPRSAVFAPEVIHFNDAIDLRRFIDGLRVAFAKSTDTGGSYSAFAHTEDGHTLQVDVHLPMRAH